MSDIQMAGPWITDHEINTITHMMQTGWYEQPYTYVETFEREFAAYHGRRFALMTPNCTTAIHLLLKSIGLQEGDEVIVPDCTWIASASPIVYERAVPVFADIEPDSWCLSPDSVEQRITPRTKAIIAVDLYGNMANWDALTAISDRHGIPLIEDSAEALGSIYKGRRAGKWGVGSVFSFHRTKTITTGEGGMLLLDDEKLYETCSIYRDHGRKKGDKPYYNRVVGFKYMPSNIQAALGYAQFQRIDEIVERKNTLFKWYREEFSEMDDIQLNMQNNDIYNGAWATSLVWGPRYGIQKEPLMAKILEKGYPARPFFYPLSSLPAFSDYAFYKEKNKTAYEISDRGITLPCALNLTREQVRIYSGIVKSCLQNAGI